MTDLSISFVKKGLAAFLLSMCLFLLPAQAQEEDKHDFISAYLQTMNLDDFKSREMLVLDLNVGDEFMEMFMTARINAVQQAHKQGPLQFDASTRVSLDVDIQLVDDGLVDETVFTSEAEANDANNKREAFSVNINAVLEIVAKEGDLYIKLASFDPEASFLEDPMYESAEREFNEFVDGVDLITGQWYQLPYSNPEEAAFSDLYLEFFNVDPEVFGENGLESLVETYLQPVLDGDVHWKEAVTDMFEEMLMQFEAAYEEDVPEKEKEILMTALEAVLNADYFNKRTIASGNYAGDVYFMLNKFSLTSLFRQLGTLFEGKVNQGDVEMFRQWLSFFSLIGRYGIDESTGLVDYLLLRLTVSDIEPLKKLTVNYGMKIFDANEPNQINAPTDAKQLDDFEELMDSVFGVGVNNDPFFDEEYGYCAIRDTNDTHYLDCVPEGEEIVLAAMRYYLDDPDLQVEIEYLPNGLHYYTCPFSEEVIECKEVESVVHDQVYGAETYTATSIDCYKNEGEYECEVDPSFDPSFDPTSAPEFPQTFDTCALLRLDDVTFADCSNEDEMLLKRALEAHVGSVVALDVSPLDEGSSSYSCQKSSLSGMTRFDCDEVSFEDFELIYDSENEIYIDCTVDFTSEERDYLCEASTDDSFESAYEYCFIRTYDNIRYLDCSGGQKGLIHGALQAYLGNNAPDDLSVVNLEEGQHFFKCQYATCEEVSPSEHEEIYDLPYANEKVYDCYATESGSEALFECEEDTSYVFTDGCFVEQIGNAPSGNDYYLDCSVPPNAIVERSLEAYVGNDLDINIAHLEEEGWYYYLCEHDSFSDYTCNELLEETYFNRDLSQVSEKKWFECLREGTDYECMEAEVVG